MRLVIALIVVVALGLAAGRAWDYEQDRYAQLRERVVQLEVHDCGLRQFEDYSVAFESHDETRFRCAAVMRNEVVCTKQYVGGDPYYALCRKP